MKTLEIMNSIKSGTFDGNKIIPSEINPHEIINIPDLRILQELSKYIVSFEYLTQTKTWKENENRQYILNSMDQLISFLREIKNGTCHCIRYKYISTYPEREENRALIEIIEQKGDYLSGEYDCKCTTCEIKWKVYYQEQRFGHSYHWLREQS